MTRDPAAIHELVVHGVGHWDDVVVERTERGTRLLAGDAVFAELEMQPRAVDLYLTLPGARRVPGIVKLLTGGADTSRHRLRLRRSDDVDAEVWAWIREAYEGATTPRT